MTNYWPIKPDTWPFAAVYLGVLPNRALRVSWQLESGLRDSSPWSFFVESNRHDGAPNGWTVIAGPQNDVASLTISLQPAVGKLGATHIRVGLTTPAGTYRSKQRSLGGLLTEKLGIYAQAINRRLTLERIGMPRVRGWLLKRRVAGTPCSCADVLSGVPTKSVCSTCYGTGIVGGYWKAIDGVLILSKDVDVKGSMENAFTVPVSRQAVLLGVPSVTVGDVWVDEARDDRYVIEQIAPSELYGLQLLCTVSMSLLHPSDIVYQFSIQ